MKLIWLGHGSWRIEAADQVLLIDPWITGNPVLPEDQHETALAGATHIILTHGHFDHAIDTVDLAKKLNVPIVGQFDVMQYWGEAKGVETIGFNKGGTVDLNGVGLTMVHAVHSSTFATPDGPRTAGSEAGYIIRAEGHTIYHSADTDVMADMAVIAERYMPDIGILCAGGHFTMDMEGAAWAAKKYFDFKMVIPSHYQSFPILAQSAQPLIDALPGIDVRTPDVLDTIEI